jgi:hypothetical protein
VNHESVTVRGRFWSPGRMTGLFLDGPGARRFNTRPLGIQSVLTHPAPPGQVAQLVEQRTENPRVVGSIPTLATISSPRRLFHSPPEYASVR